jgi:hypothetical protein
VVVFLEAVGERGDDYLGEQAGRALAHWRERYAAEGSSSESPS